MLMFDRGTFNHEAENIPFDDQAPKYCYSTVLFRFKEAFTPAATSLNAAADPEHWRTRHFILGDEANTF